MLDSIQGFSSIILIVLILSGFIFGHSLIWIILGPFIKTVVLLFSGIRL
jgi:hypothetical protein